MYTDKIKKILFTEEEIKKRVAELGKQITEDYKDKDLVLVCLLKGAAWFCMDLNRAIDLPCQIDFMVVSSYGNGTETSGSVKVRLDVSCDLRGKDVLLIDDIVDSGVTLGAISAMLKEHSPASIRTIALCDKEERRTNGFKCDYVGFVIPDEFVVGYGLDFAQDYRNLPFIGVLKSSTYEKK